MIEELEIRVESSDATAATKRFGLVLEEAMNRGEEATEKLHKSHSKLKESSHLLHRSVGQLGAIFGESSNHAVHFAGALAGLGQMMLEGGIVGAGIGAFSLALTGLQAVWEKNHEATKLAQEDLKRLGKEVEDLALILSNSRAELEMIGLSGGGREESILQHRIESQAKLVKAMEGLVNGPKTGGYDAFGRKNQAAIIDDANAALLEGRVINKDTLEQEKRKLELLQEQVRTVDERNRKEYEGAHPPEKPGLKLQPPSFGGRDVTDGDQFQLKMPGMLANEGAIETAHKAEMDRRQGYADEVLSLQERVDAGLNEIVADNAEIRGEIQAKALAESLEQYQKWAGLAASVVGSFTDAALGALEDLVAGEKVSGEQIAADMLKSIGKQLMGMGLRDVLEGGSRLVRSYGIDQTGTELMVQGAAEFAAGLALGAGGAVLAGDVRGKASAGNAGSMDYGAGGSTGFGGAGNNRQVDQRPVIIQVNGAFTTEEQSVLVQQGMNDARKRGLLS